MNCPNCNIEIEPEIKTTKNLHLDTNRYGEIYIELEIQYCPECGHIYDVID